MNETIQFKKQRELGAILSDTFKFIRMEWKTLFGLIFRIAGPALILVIIAYVIYMQATVGSIGNANPLLGSSPELFGLTFILAALLLLGAAVVYYALLYGTVLSYIKSYVANNGVVNAAEVSSGVRQNFWSMLGLNFLVVVMTVIGFLFCFVPGIYLGVVLATTFSILIFEKRDVMDSISYSFNLIKNEWWITFATILVIGILYYIILVIFQIPQYIYFFIRTISMSQQVSADPTDMFDWIYVALSTIGVIAQYLLQTILVISTAFIYFNLNEKKNFTGTMETIDSLGTRDETDA